MARNPAYIVRAWLVLMKRLGYTRFRGSGRRLGRDHHGSHGFSVARGNDRASGDFVRTRGGRRPWRPPQMVSESAGGRAFIFTDV
jgi:hypothetical protein